MQSKENIAEELKLISEPVAAIPRGSEHPYALPQGYFEGLPGRIMEAIRAQGIISRNPGATTLHPHFVKDNPYAVPQGYFEGFAGKLLARIKAGQSGDPREELSVLSPLLDRIDKRSPFQAPEGYFSNLTGNVLSGVQAIEFVNDELENLPSLMTGLQNKPVYEVPAGYFDSFAGNVLARVKKPAAISATVISMENRSSGATGSRRGFRKWVKYSAAAVTTGLILTMGWLGFHRPAFAPVNNDLTASLSKVSDQEILNYLENQNIPASETIANSTATATLDLNDADVKNFLGNVSDAELDQYLEDNGGTKNLVTN
jgi:hypothetical protein